MGLGRFLLHGFSRVELFGEDIEKRLVNTDRLIPVSALIFNGAELPEALYVLRDEAQCLLIGDGGIGQIEQVLLPDIGYQTMLLHGACPVLPAFIERYRLLQRGDGAPGIAAPPLGEGQPVVDFRICLFKVKGPFKLQSALVELPHLIAKDAPQLLMNFRPFPGVAGHLQEPSQQFGAACPLPRLFHQFGEGFQGAPVTPLEIEDIFICGNGFFTIERTGGPARCHPGINSFQGLGVFIFSGNFAEQPVYLFLVSPMGRHGGQGGHDFHARRFELEDLAAELLRFIEGGGVAGIYLSQPAQDESPLRGAIQMFIIALPDPFEVTGPDQFLGVAVHLGRPDILGGSGQLGAGILWRHHIGIALGHEADLPWQDLNIVNRGVFYLRDAPAPARQDILHQIFHGYDGTGKQALLLDWLGHQHLEEMKPDEGRGLGKEPIGSELIGNDGDLIGTGDLKQAAAGELDGLAGDAHPACCQDEAVAQADRQLLEAELGPRYIPSAQREFNHII